MAVGFVGKVFRAIRSGTKVSDIRKSPSLSPSPVSLYSSSSTPVENEVPTPPKKPLSPYMLFLQKKRLEVFGNSSDLKITEQVKVLAEKWRNLNEVEKEEYKEEYKKNVAQYVEVQEAYLKSLSQQQLETLVENSNLRRIDVHKRKVKAKLRKLNKPVGVRNPFSFFVSKETPAYSKVPVTEAIKNISSKWKALPKEEKDVYRKMTEDDKIRYTAEMSSWTKKMIEEGHSHLLKEIGKNPLRKEKKLDTQREEKMSSKSKVMQSAGSKVHSK